MKGKLVVGNWKMNGDRSGNRSLLEQIVGAMPSGLACAVSVPFPFLEQAEGLLEGSGIALAAQNVSEFSGGAYTGEVSCSMLADFSVKYVIVGHSERRSMFGESDEVVARKALAVVRSGLTPIICVGETLGERDAGAVEAVLMRQLDAVRAALDPELLQKVVIAYEPVWAIGTGRAASGDQIQDVLAFIRRWLAAHVHDASSIAILYGGSVKADGAGALFRLPDVDGGLIGGASLDASQFLEICRAAAGASQRVVD
ncbi:triose-phosphate isomerase [Azoarcus sp. KH32C]|uniref:triose-phosphate isomerase n=1 Tax=Azoarcus sp. KH32C TaxID=748247 RepID=UPI000238698E|nr:triose-phosphate isomerase [Azoarcus sp. KH32C]BAL25368.1 triosephosphate isomerase [Azoarcus sp. KH32C]